MLWQCHDDPKWKFDKWELLKREEQEDRKFRSHLVELLNNSFSVFKQHYTLFHSHIFQKTTNNITQTSLPNGFLGLKVIPLINGIDPMMPWTILSLSLSLYIYIYIYIYFGERTILYISSQKTYLIKKKQYTFLNYVFLYDYLFVL